MDNQHEISPSMQMVQDILNMILERQNGPEADLSALTTALVVAAKPFSVKEQVLLENVRQSFADVSKMDADVQRFIAMGKQ